MNPIPRPARDERSQETKTAPRAPQCQTLSGARLRKHAEFQRAYAQARKRQSGSMSWFMAPQPEDQIAGQFAQHGTPAARVGLTVGKVIGKSHERNRIKRRMREALRHHVALLPPGFDLIFHPRRTVLTLEFTKLEAEVMRILEQARKEAERLRAPDGARVTAPE